MNAYTLYTSGAACTVWLVWTDSGGHRRTAFLMTTDRDHGDRIVQAFRQTPASANFPAVCAAVNARKEARRG